MNVISSSVPGFRVAEYGNYPFDSACTFNGEHIAVGADGIYRLDADSDYGAKIEASVLTGLTTFNSTNYKRINDAFAGVRCPTGTLTFVTVANERAMRTATSTKPDADGSLRQVRFQVSKRYGAAKAREWQFGFTNNDGNDFTLVDLSIYEHTLTRSEK